MAKIVDIKEAPNRFLSIEEFEQIKNRAQRLPQGFYRYNGSDIVCDFLNEKNEIVLTKVIFPEPQYPGLLELLLNLKDDMEALITHIENADIENDILIEK